MNRQIKFRGLRTDGKGWVYGFYVLTSNRYHHILTGKWDRICGGHYSYEVIPETVGQFTGLTDKNGTEIYEGDIVRQYFYNSSHLTRSKLFDVPVIYQENEFTFDVSVPQSEKYGHYSLFDFCVVVGNIHKESEVTNE